MKKISSILISIFLSGFINAQMPTDGLVSYWSFNSNTEDAMNYQDGVQVGNVLPATNRFGDVGCALSFDGSPTSLVLLQGFEEYNISPDSSLSISLWYQGGSDEAGDQEILFLKYGDGFNPLASPAYSLSLYDLNKAVMYVGNASLWMSDEVVTFPPNSDWHHLVAVYEAGHWKMFYDNVLIEELENSSAHVEQISSDIVIGASFEGSLDDITFYKKALSLLEIDALYNLPSDCNSTGIEKIDEKEVLIYPNPVTEILNIELIGTNVNSIKISNILGETLIDRPINSKHEQVQLTTLSTGMYILSLFDNNNLISHHSLIVE